MTTTTTTSNRSTLLYDSPSSAVTSTSPRRLAIYNLLAYIVNALVVYGLGAYGDKFGYEDNASISHKYQTLVTPADWAFAIWGIIYTAQLIWVIVCLMRSNHNPSTRDILQAVGYNYIGASMAQILWTVCFTTEHMISSLLAMITIMLYLFRATQSLRSVSANYWLYKFPITSHFGWILAATGVNVNVVLVALQLSRNVLVTASLLTLGLLLFESLYLTWTRYDWIVPLTVVWALYGVSKELQSPQASISAKYEHRQIDAIQWIAKMGAMTITAAVFVKAVLVTSERRRRGERAVPEEEQVYLRVNDTESSS